MSVVRWLTFLVAAPFVWGCAGGASGPARPLASLPPAAEAGAQEVWATDPTQQSMSSRWFLDLAGEPVTLTLTADLDGSHVLGSAIAGDGTTEVIDNIAWDALSGVLDFRRFTAGVTEWVHARSIEGVITGRFGYGLLGEGPPKDVEAYNGHLVGWNDYYFSRDLVPRVFDLEVDGQMARLRLDRDAGGALVGRFKVYANEESGNRAEEVEYDIDVQAWDGHTLAFTRTTPDATQTFSATVDGNTLLGTMTIRDGAAPAMIDGTRAELLAYGLGTGDPAARDGWQARTRRQLAHLMMADNPAPLSLSVDRAPYDLPPDDDELAPDRDDDADDWSPDYGIDELQLAATLPNPYGGAPLTRAMHGFLTTPPGTPPVAGWPAIVVLNGHDGSARGTLDPYNSLYWYGDAWARRGYVVLAIDVGHRPLADRAALYHNYVNGDRPTEGNGTHPAIRSDALDSDWVEDGERTWDVERAIDYLNTLGTIDVGRVAVTGLSMGGEVASFAAALDPRIAVVVPAGFVPDLTVMRLNGNHACWRWITGDPRDYFSISDLHALIAPRPLIVETGIEDYEFSKIVPPFIDGKEVARRSRAAFAGAASAFALYLHPGGHEYRFGDVNVTTGDAPLDLTVPAIDGPRAPGDLTWAADSTTVNLGETLADVLGYFLAAP